MEKLKNSNFKGFSVYIHFPFCVSKCLYCDFTSFKFERDLYKKYFDYLKREILLFVEKFPSNSKKRISTLYFGGGTPSLIDEDLLSSFLTFLRSHFDFSTLSEFTIEANPESIDKTKFKTVKMLGVNRVSMGVQSFNDETLRILGRAHDSKTAIEKFEILRDVGFLNINLDLIFALPNETFEMQMNSLNKAITLNPEHISYYALMLERGTPLNRLKNKFTFVDERTWLKEFRHGKRLLEDAGFIHYEISNFAKKSYECLHNFSYWKSYPYLGFGISAGGFYNGIRYVNVRNFEKYFEKIDNGILPYSFKKRLPVNVAKGEFLMMGLRLLEGVGFDEYYYRFGSFLVEDFKNKISKLKALKLIKVSSNKIALTKKGVQYANVVFRELI